MLNFLMQNAGTIVVGLIVIAIIITIIVKMVKANKKGESFCGCQCNGCPNSQVCHKTANID